MKPSANETNSFEARATRLPEGAGKHPTRGSTNVDDSHMFRPRVLRAGHIIHESRNTTARDF
eukprot:15485518-Alexandrium_andersonii.AAC.1